MLLVVADYLPYYGEKLFEEDSRAITYSTVTLICKRAMGFYRRRISMRLKY
jgi:hypothetical protein